MPSSFLHGAFRNPRISGRNPRVAAIILVASLLLGTAFVGLSIHDPISASISSRSDPHPPSYRLTSLYAGVPYDEQSGFTFTQNFSTLTFNVTAVAQTGLDGNGPGYLLSGMTDASYWYQVGLSYKWPDTTGGHLPGFDMNYEVFNNNGNSIDPATGGGGIANITVNAGDTVLLSLNFTSTAYVSMTAHDWNTRSTVLQQYPLFGDPYFVGLPGSISQLGYFTGLMTEQYHSSPYTGNSQTVVYSDSSFGYASTWLWIDEWNTQTGYKVFEDQTASPVSLIGASSGSWPAYFSSNGTAEAANDNQFATGLQPMHTGSIQLSVPAVNHPGGSATISLSLQNSDPFPGRLADATIVTDFGNFTIPEVSSLSPGTTRLSLAIAIPSSLRTGNHTITVEGEWQVLIPSLNAWVGSRPIETSSLLPVTNSLQPSASLFQELRSLLLEILVFAGAAVVVVVALVLAFSRRRTIPQSSVPSYGPQPSPACPRCGQAVSSGMVFCPHCGSSLNSPSNQPGMGAGPPPGQPPS